MRDVFISHADEDAPVALAIARALNAAGYTTWCYEDDSDPGPSYLRQIDEELESTQAVVLIISPFSLQSQTVVAEIVRAHEARKPFIPLRLGVGHEAVQRQGDFRMALGASVSIAIPDGSVDAIFPRIIRGLERTGVRPSGLDSVAQVASSKAGHPDPKYPVRVPPPMLRAVGDRVSQAVDRVSPTTRIGITTVVGVLGVIGSFANVTNAINPDGQTEYLYRLVPTIGTANLVANAIMLALNAVLLFSVWQLYSQKANVSARVRLVTAVMLMAIVVWLVVVVFAALFPPNGRLQGSARLSVIGASVLAAVIAGVPAALVRSLFRR